MADLSWGATRRDGTAAAVALLGNSRVADAVPPSGYSTIVASKPLSAAAAESFLTEARRATHTHRLEFRTVALPSGEPVDWSFAQTSGQASVVEVAPDRDHRDSFRRLALRSVRKAQDAGATVRTTGDARHFLRLYADASAAWSMRYPDALVRRLGEVGVARFDEVWIDGDAVAALMTLRGAAHWMCWLAAQNESGRAVSASYLAYDVVLRDAPAEVRYVSFGASAPGTQGLEFKRRLGATEVPSYRWAAVDLVGNLLQVRSALAARVRA
jgi:Acetyltransferase (GNAT) domain